MSSLDYLDLCRLCLVKERVSVPIFEGEGDVRQIFLKIAACLPVKVAREDKLPKKICDDCVYKVELFYQFWNTTANAEKQLLQWLGEVNLEDKQSYVTTVLSPSVLKQEQSTENRLDGSVMQQVGEQNNIGMGMMDNMGLNIPMMMSSANQQQITSVPMDTSGNSVQTVQAVPGPSSQSTHNQMPQNQTGAAQQEEEEESSEDDENTDDECDAEGLPVKEESEEDVNANRTIEPTTFVNVSLACDEAGPSGLQQQKIADMPEMAMPQSADGDPKSGIKNQVTTQPKSRRLPTPQKSKISGTSIVKLEDSSKDSLTVPNDTPHGGSSCPEEIDTNATILINETGKLLNKTSSSLEQSNQVVEVKTELKSNKTIARKCDTIRSLQCSICHKVFKKQEYFDVHVKSHNTSHECRLCGVKLSSAHYLTLHIMRHFKKFTEFCGICNKGFHLKSSLKTHMKVHTIDKPCLCEICHKSFKNKACLRSHMKMIHTQPENRKKYKCETCNFETLYSYCYNKHLAKHTGEIQAPCEVCGKSIRRHYMKFHMRIHTGEKPEICEFCGKGFSSRDYLVKHRRTHTGEKPYDCKICDKRFTQRSSLNTHLRIHKIT